MPRMRAAFFRPCLYAAMIAAFVDLSSQAQSSRAQPDRAGNRAPAGRTFDIDEYRIEGNTVLPPVELERAVTPFLGPGRTEQDIERARAALEELYNKRGYPTVSAEIPRQSASGGLVVIKVTERKVGRLRVTGSRYFSLDKIKQGAPSLSEGRVPNINDVQSDIVGLNQQADRTVTPSLKPGRTLDTVDVDLQVVDHFPLHGSTELNNRQQVGTRPLRTDASLSYNNLFQRGDSISASFQLAPQDPAQSEIVAASYLFQIPDSKLALLASFTHNDSNVNTLGSTAALGRGTTAGLRLQVPLWFEPGFTQTLSTGLDYKNYTQTLKLAGSSSATPLVYYPFSISYSANWSGDVSQTNLSATFVMGTPIFGSNTAAFQENRAYATPSFIYLRTILDHTHELPWGMQAYAKAQAQLVRPAAGAAGTIFPRRTGQRARLLRDGSAGGLRRGRANRAAQPVLRQCHPRRGGERGAGAGLLRHGLGRHLSAAARTDQQLHPDVGRRRSAGARV